MRILTYALSCQCLLLANPSIAEMRPLGDLVSEGSETSYVAIRCAVLYLAPVAYAGSERFEPEFVVRATDTFDQLTGIAVNIRIEDSGGSVDVVGPAVLSDAGAIMTLYLDRFDANYASSGQAFGSDELYASDVDFCGTIFGTP